MNGLKLIYNFHCGIIWDNFGVWGWNVSCGMLRNLVEVSGKKETGHYSIAPGT